MNEPFHSTTSQIQLNLQHSSLTPIDILSTHTHFRKFWSLHGQSVQGRTRQGVSLSRSPSYIKQQPHPEPLPSCGFSPRSYPPWSQRRFWVLVGSGSCGEQEVFTVRSQKKMVSPHVRACNSSTRPSHPPRWGR